MSEEQYKATEAVVKEFVNSGGEGEALNKRLIAKDRKNKHTSYITGMGWIAKNVRFLKINMHVVFLYMFIFPVCSSVVTRL